MAALAFVIYDTLTEHIVEAGDKAPDFKVVTEKGRTVTRSNFGGKLLVLNFWATWCPPCVQEMPSLIKFSKEMADKGVVVVGVSVDKNDKQYQNFIKRYKIPFETARDPEANISASYGTYKYPETYIIDMNGKVVEKIISAPEQGWMDPAIIGRIKRFL